MRCAIEGCSGPVRARGWCEMHYFRWRRHGDPMTVLAPGPKATEGPRCSFDGCAESARGGGRGWCSLHYQRWRRNGDPAVERAAAPRRARRDVMERIRERVRITESGCWEWLGNRLRTGYGRIGVGRRGVHLVHRVAWEYVNGPIPAGHDAHHTCGNRWCCNHEHIRPMPTEEHRAHHAGGRRHGE